MSKEASNRDKEFSRRTFIKGTLPFVTALAAAECNPAKTQIPDPTPDRKPGVKPSGSGLP